MMFASTAAVGYSAYRHLHLCNHSSCIAFNEERIAKSYLRLTTPVLKMSRFYSKEP